MRNNVDMKLYEQIDIDFIPIVNVDTYILINNFYGTSNYEKMRNLRKNRNTRPKSDQCSFLSTGVDLNRNYGYKFEFNSESGGSNDPCAEDHRGTKAFSEPETQAIKNFIENNSQI